MSPLKQKLHTLSSILSAHNQTEKSAGEISFTIALSKLLDYIRIIRLYIRFNYNWPVIKPWIRFRHP